MNALGLATDLDAASSEMEYGYVVSDWKLLSMSADLLRKQEQEIKNLVKTLDSALEELIRLKNERI